MPKLLGKTTEKRPLSNQALKKILLPATGIASYRVNNAYSHCFVNNNAINENKIVVISRRSNCIWWHGWLQTCFRKAAFLIHHSTRNIHIKPSKQVYKSSISISYFSPAQHLPQKVSTELVFPFVFFFFGHLRHVFTSISILNNALKVENNRDESPACNSMMIFVIPSS